MRRLWAVVFAGCVHHGAPQTGSAGFSVSYPDAHGATVKQGARFYAKPEAKCFYDNGREARWTIGGAHVASGELPPGLTLEDGVIGGVAKQAGTYHARIELADVTCEGKPVEARAVDVDITVQ
jgi:hypothetical protein